MLLFVFGLLMQTQEAKWLKCTMYPWRKSILYLFSLSVSDFAIVEWRQKTWRYVDTYNDFADTRSQVLYFMILLKCLWNIWMQYVVYYRKEKKYGGKKHLTNSSNIKSETTHMFKPFILDFVKWWFLIFN